MVGFGTKVETMGCLGVRHNLIRDSIRSEIRKEGDWDRDPRPNICHKDIELLDKPILI